MKKTINTVALSVIMAMACSSAALADGNAFTPLNFEDPNFNSAPVEKVSVKTASNDTAKTTANEVSALDMPGNTKMQSAILELDNAQVDVRNELLNYKTKYSDIDSQYTMIRSERKALGKQVKATEKRIKQIETAKEKIRKNML